MSSIDMSDPMAAFDQHLVMAGDEDGWVWLHCLICLPNIGFHSHTNSICCKLQEGEDSEEDSTNLKPEQVVHKVSQLLNKGMEHLIGHYQAEPVTTGEPEPDEEPVTTQVSREELLKSANWIVQNIRIKGLTKYQVVDAVMWLEKLWDPATKLEAVEGIKHGLVALSNVWARCGNPTCEQHYDSFIAVLTHAIDLAVKEFQESEVDS